MKHIKLITFKGCQSTVDFHDTLEDLIAEDGLDATVEMVQVPSPEDAEEYGLRGSPTIFVRLKLAILSHGPTLSFSPSTEASGLTWSFTLASSRSGMVETSHSARLAAWSRPDIACFRITNSQRAMVRSSS